VTGVQTCALPIYSNPPGSGRDTIVDVTIEPPPGCAGENCCPQLLPGEAAHYTATPAFAAGGLGRLAVAAMAGNQAEENEDGTFSLTSDDENRSAVSFLFGRYFWIEADGARDLDDGKLDESGQDLDVLMANDARRGFVAFPPPAFGELTHLSAAFESIEGGSGYGSPRLEVHLGDRGILRIRLGQPPAYSDANATLEASSGMNLIGNGDAGRFDLSRLLPPGPSSASWSEALVAAGGHVVTRVDFVTDSGPGREFVLHSIDLEAAPD
jgi:hypothetical protein